MAQLGQMYFTRLQEAEKTIFELNNKLADLQCRDELAYTAALKAEVVKLRAREAERVARIDALETEVARLRTREQERVVQLVALTREGREKQARVDDLKKALEDMRGVTRGATASSLMPRNISKSEATHLPHLKFMSMVGAVHRYRQGYLGELEPLVHNAKAAAFVALFNSFFASLGPDGMNAFALIKNKWKEHPLDRLPQAYCVRTRLTKDSAETDWHKGAGYACRECVALGLPCFKVQAFSHDNPNSVLMLPLHPTDRQCSQLRGDSDHCIWVNAGKRNATSSNSPQAGSKMVAIKDEPLTKKIKIETKGEPCIKNIKSETEE